MKRKQTKTLIEKMTQNLTAEAMQIEQPDALTTRQIDLVTIVSSVTILATGQDGLLRALPIILADF